MTETVLEPYGVPEDDLVLRFDDESFARLSDRISVTFDLTMDQPVPLLAEAGPETAMEWNPAFGAYGTMGALTTFYRGLLEDLADAEQRPARRLRDLRRGSPSADRLRRDPPA